MPSGSDFQPEAARACGATEDDKAHVPMTQSRHFQPAQLAANARDDREDDEIDLFAMLMTLWRGKLVILAAMLLAVLVGGYYAYGVAVPIYSATAVVTLENRQQQAIDLESVVSGIGTDQSAINTELGIIRSRGLIEKLVDRLDLTQDPEFNAALRPEPAVSAAKLAGWVRAQVQGPRPAAVEVSDAEIRNATVNAVLEAISVSNVRQSYLFEITAVSEDPAKSVLLANTLADLYILDQIEVKFEKTEQATEWLSERVAQLQVDLQTAEESLKSFVAGSATTSPEALGALDRQIKALRERRDEAAETLARATARADALASARALGEPAAMVEVAQDPALTRLEDELAAGPVPQGSPFERRYDTVLARAALERDRARDQVAALETTLVDLDAQFTRQSRDLVQLQQLQRDAEASRMIYEYFLARLKETSVQQGVQQADSRVLSLAIERPAIAPRTSRLLLLSAILGLMAGAGYLLLREMRNTGIRSSDQLEKLTRLTVLGQIPRLPARRRGAVLDHLVEHPGSAMAEALRNLRTSILMSNVDAPPQVIMSTSSVPGEGKTTLSIALAHNLSALGKKVLLIEGDVRRRVFSEYFSSMSERGLLAAVAGEVTLEQVMRHDTRTGIDVLTGEKSSVNAADLFSSRRFAEFITGLRDRYDYIVIDTPPVLVVPDARIIGRNADAIVYCVNWDSTAAEQVTAGLRMFENLGIRVSGLVLNQIDARKMKRYGHGGTYGAYSGYGANYYTG